MDYLYSLYDAVVSINVPSDKARAVVDGMRPGSVTVLGLGLLFAGLKLT